MNTKEIFKSYILIIILFFLFSIASTMDFEDAQAEHEHYCEMVKKGMWPDFKNLIEYCGE